MKCKQETKMDSWIWTHKDLKKSLEMLASNDPIFMFKNLHFVVMLGDIFVTTWYI